MKLSPDDTRALEDASVHIKTLIGALEPRLTADICRACGARRYNDFTLFQTLEKLRGIDTQLATVMKAAREP